MLNVKQGCGFELKIDKIKKIVMHYDKLQGII